MSITNFCAPFIKDMVQLIPHPRHRFAIFVLRLGGKYSKREI